MEDWTYSFFLDTASPMVPIHLQFILNSLMVAFKIIPIDQRPCSALAQHMVLLVFVFVQWNVITMQITEDWLWKQFMFSMI